MYVYAPHTTDWSVARGRYSLETLQRLQRFNAVHGIVRDARPSGLPAVDAYTQASIIAAVERQRRES